MPGNYTTPIEVAEEVDVDEDTAADILDYLVTNGWMSGNNVQFNVRSEGRIVLPEN